MQKKEALPIIPSSEMFAGDAKAPVEVTMFGDYESNETRELNETMKEVLKTFESQIKFTFRHFPLTQLHQRAHKAAEAAIGAGQEGKFWEMHQLLLDHPRELGIISLKGHAREAGVINKRFLEQLMNGDFGWYVQDDLRAGLELGVREIPVLLVNGKTISRPLTLNRVKNAIRNELKNCKAVKAPRRAAA